MSMRSRRLRRFYNWFALALKRHGKKRFKSANLNSNGPDPTLTSMRRKSIFSLYGADEASATLAIKITSRDGTVEIADALCTLSLLKAKTSGNDTASALKKLREQFGLRRETVGGQHRVQA